MQSRLFFAAEFIGLLTIGVFDVFTDGGRDRETLLHRDTAVQVASGNVNSPTGE